MLTALGHHGYLLLLPQIATSRPTLVAVSTKAPVLVWSLSMHKLQRLDPNIQRHFAHARLANQKLVMSVFKSDENPR